jgi:hypothetical protein
MAGNYTAGGLSDWVVGAEDKPASGEKINWTSGGGSPPGGAASFLSPITNAAGFPNPGAGGMDSAVITGVTSSGKFSGGTSWSAQESSHWSLKELSDIDPFFRFPKVDPKDFNKVFAYEFKIWKTDLSERYSIILPIPPQSI